jgi:hypothetical protein
VSRTQDGKGYQVLTSVTDTRLAQGRTVTDALRNLAKNTGMRVNYVDEVANGKVLGRFG